MNLTAEEYLNLMDQVSLLKIEKERFQRDNITLSHQVQNQKRVIREFKENDLNSLAAFSSNKTMYESSKSFNPKNPDLCAEQFKESLNHLQRNFFEFVTTSTTEQMKQMKDEMNKMRLQFKSLQSQKSTGEECKTDNKVSKRQQASEKLRKQSHRKELQNFYEKVKFVYHLWNQDQKDPSHQQLISWMNRLNLESNKSQPNEQFNPIRAIKQAKSSKKQSQTNLSIQKREINASKKNKTNRQEEEKKLIQESLKLYYKNQESNRKVKRQKSVPNEQEPQISILKPKLKKQSKKQIEKEVSKIQKKSITLHKGPLRMIKQQKQSKHPRQNSIVSDVKKNSKSHSINATKADEPQRQKKTTKNEQNKSVDSANKSKSKLGNALKNFEPVKSIKEGKSLNKQNFEKRTNSSKKILPKSKSQANLNKDIDALKEKVKKFEYFTDVPSKIMKSSKQMKVEPQVNKKKKD